MTAKVAISADLNETVIKGGYCVGCGACAAASGSTVRMEFRAERFVAVATDRLSQAASEVCPFSDSAATEDEIAQRLFRPHVPRHDPRLGFYLRGGAVHVTDDGRRIPSSSGGIVTWLLERLLEEKVVDGILHVRPRQATADDPRLFAYAVSSSAEEVRQGASSRYYPVTMADVLKEVRERPERYALVGLPCFIKAFRLLSHAEPEWSRRIPLTIGLVCGHLKTAGFAELLAAQVGIAPTELRAINFRKKLPDRPANQYGIEVTSRDAAATIVRPVTELLGSDWGHSFFKYASCDFCDDIFAETADVAVGDAWLPAYRKDWKGTSLVLTRNETIDKLIADGVRSGHVSFTEVSTDELVASQRSNFAHRRKALPYRLELKDREGVWRPKKRFEKEAVELSVTRKRIIELRAELAELTQHAWHEVRTLSPIDEAVSRFRSIVSPSLAELQYLSFQGEPETRSSAFTRRGILQHGKRASAAATRRIRMLVRTLTGARGHTRALVVPPASPGSLGDDAVVRSVVAQLKKRGVSHITFLSYSKGDSWISVAPDMSVLCIAPYLSYGSLTSALGILSAALNSDFGVVCGTDVLDGHHNLSKSLARLELCNLLADAGLPLTIVGASFSEEAVPATRHALRITNGKLDFCARDPISYGVVQEFHGEGLRLVADPAFLLEPVVSPVLEERLFPWIEARRAEGKLILGFNANHFLCKGETATAVAESFAASLRDVCDKHETLAVCLIPHDVRGRPSDVDLAKLILDMLSPRLGTRITQIPPGLNSAEIKAVASRMDVVFSGKMHLSIAALGSEIPVGCITYKDKKFLGLFTHFGLQEWLIPEDTWRRPEAITAFLCRLIESKDSIQTAIRIQLPRVRALAGENFRGMQIESGSL